MKSLTYAIHLLFLVTPQQSWSRPLQPNDVVNDTCRPMPFPGYCVSTLRSDPKSASASAKGSQDVGVIVIDHIDAKSKGTLPRIRNLILRAKDHKLTAALKFCNGSYTVIVVASLPASRGALISGDPKLAENYITDAAQEMDHYDEEFKGLKSPLAGENDFECKAASIVATIARMLE